MVSNNRQQQRNRMEWKKWCQIHNSTPFLLLSTCCIIWFWDCTKWSFNISKTSFSFCIILATSSIEVREISLNHRRRISCIHCLERCHLSGLMVVCIILEFSKTKPPMPLSRFGACHASQISLQASVHHFRFSTSLQALRWLHGGYLVDSC